LSTERVLDIFTMLPKVRWSAAALQLSLILS